MLSRIEDTLKRFVSDHIDSVETLEVLLLLHDQEHRQWSALEVSRALRKHPASISKRLADLYLHGLLTVSETSELCYRFHFEDTELVELVDKLQSAYKTHRTQIIDLIFSKPIDKLSVFAEAFRFREGKKDG